MRRSLTVPHGQTQKEALKLLRGSLMARLKKSFPDGKGFGESWEGNVGKLIVPTGNERIRSVSVSVVVLPAQAEVNLEFRTHATLEREGVSVVVEKVRGVLTALLG